MCLKLLLVGCHHPISQYLHSNLSVVECCHSSEYCCTKQEPQDILSSHTVVLVYSTISRRPTALDQWHMATAFTYQWDSNTRTERRWYIRFYPLEWLKSRLVLFRCSHHEPSEPRKLNGNNVSHTTFNSYACLSDIRMYTSFSTSSEITEHLNSISSTTQVGVNVMIAFNTNSLALTMSCCNCYTQEAHKECSSTHRPPNVTDIPLCHDMIFQGSISYRVALDSIQDRPAFGQGTSKPIDTW